MITDEGPRIGAVDRQGNPTYALNNADAQTFSTDWLCDRAIDFIGDHQNRPFCYMISLPDPHGPNTVRPPYDTMYEDTAVPIPVTLTRRPDQIPAWGKSAGVKPAQLQKLMRSYYGMVKCIDDNVGEILAVLRERNLLDRTLIVFTSDHGDLCGEHGRLNKGVPYEGSARIPFLLYCPGEVKPGTVIREALGTVDFLPTVMNLLDVPVPHPVEGRDASALFTQEKVDSWEDITFVRSTSQPGRPGNAWIAAITGQFKLVYSTSEEPWLIDLKNDPNELTNLISRREHWELARWMTERLVAYGRTCQDDYPSIPRIQTWIDQVQTRN